ncbi:helix-turn-helix transcriptional regulator [Dactylosporangium sp. NPDC048998]|uniref:helix-turn-helix transcriptional regulator n=1 Tax=Dactylosporangium sp. NPDC048998 TaxID=3363976 RepID=UPI0037188F6E
MNTHHNADQPAPAVAASATACRQAATSWTAESIRALGAVTTVPVAGAIFGLSRSVAYDLVKRNQFPVPVLRFGHRYRIPVAAILTALHMPVEPPPPST